MTAMLLEWAATSVFLMLVVLALRAALGKRISARLRYGLWAVVLVRLLVPVQLFTSPIAGTRVFTGPAEPDIYRVTDDGLEKGGREDIAALGGQDGPTVSIQSPTVPVFPAAPTVPDASEPPDPPDFAKLAPMLGWVWLAGGAVTAAVLLAANLKFYLRLRRTRKPFEEDEERRAHDVRPYSSLPVYVADGLPSPCLFGVLRPAVYVTAETAADPAALRHVLVHEQVHFRHGDHVWNLLRCAALCLHWWDPLAWVSAALSRRDGEMACDEGALERLGDGERAAYGGTVLALVTAKPTATGLLTCATTMAGDKKSLKERISRIAKAPRRWLWAALAVVLVTALACACAFGREAEEKPAPWEELEADLSLTVDDDIVRITGTVDGMELPRGAFWWNPDSLFSESPYGELFLVYPPFTDGIEGQLNAWWTDESRTAVNLSTEPTAMCSSYWPSGYWEFTVDFSDGTAKVTRMEAIANFPEGMEVQMHPKTISDEEAVRAGRIAARLLTAAEKCWADRAEKGTPPQETEALNVSPESEAEEELLSHFKTSVLYVDTDVLIPIGNWVREEYEGYSGRIATWPHLQETGAPAFDDWRITSLSGPWTNTVDYVDVEVWRINYEFHTTEPDKAEQMLVGGMYLTEDGWLCPTYPDCTYFIFTLDEAGERQFETAMMHNRTSFPETTQEGEEKFYADVSEALRERSILSGAAVMPAAEPVEEMTELPYHPDLNRNGVPETLLVGQYCHWTPGGGPDDSYTALGVGVWENGELLWSSTSPRMGGERDVYLLTNVDGVEYMLYYYDCSSCMLFDLTEHGSSMRVHSSVSISYTLTPPEKLDFDVEEIDRFTQSTDRLLAGATVLVDESGVFDGKELKVDFSWLGNFVPGFTWDERATNLENLTRVKEIASRPEPAPTPVDAGSAARARTELREALLGQRDFTYYTAVGHNIRSTAVNIASAPQTVFPLTGEYGEIWSFSVIDLDGDGAEEAVLHIYGVAGDAGGYLILRWAGPGDVRGYSSYWRTFWSLKTDGTFDYDYYMGVYGTARVSFPAPGHAMEQHSLMEAREAGGDPPTGTFTVNGEEVTYEEYEAAWDRQKNEKPDAEWFDFTEEDVRRALG